MSDMFAKLAAPFSPHTVSWRVGPTNGDKTKGIALAYIDARDVMARLDEVCTPGGWQNRYMVEGSKTVCEIGIKCGEEWIWKADGAGDSDMEADKGALSDAFKRSAVRWGIGRYLYEIDSPWVEIKPQGKSFVITPSEKTRLAALLGAKAVVPQGVDDPPKQKAPTKAQIDGAREWANESIEYVNGLKKNNELQKFLSENAKKLDWLQTALPDEYKALNARINKKLDEFLTIGAG